MYGIGANARVPGRLGINVRTRVRAARIIGIRYALDAYVAREGIVVDRLIAALGASVVILDSDLAMCVLIPIHVVIVRIMVVVIEVIVRGLRIYGFDSYAAGGL